MVVHTTSLSGLDGARKCCCRHSCHPMCSCYTPSICRETPSGSSGYAVLPCVVYSILPKQSACYAVLAKPMNDCVQQQKCTCSLCCSLAAGGKVCQEVCQHVANVGMHLFVLSLKHVVLFELEPVCLFIVYAQMRHDKQVHMT